MMICLNMKIGITDGCESKYFKILIRNNITIWNCGLLVFVNLESYDLSNFLVKKYMNMFYILECMWTWTFF